MATHRPEFKRGENNMCPLTLPCAVVVAAESQSMVKRKGQVLQISLVSLDWSSTLLMGTYQITKTPG